MRTFELKNFSLIDSSIPEDQYNGAAVKDGKWIQGSYSIDAVVYSAGATPHMVYKSLINSNTAVPGTDESAWDKIGPTDRWAAFDYKTSSQSAFGSAGSAEISANLSNGIILSGLDATRLRLTHIINDELLTDPNCSSDSFISEDGCAYNSGDSRYDFDGTQAEESKLFQIISALMRGTIYIVRFSVENYAAGTICGLVADIKGEPVSGDGIYTQIIFIDPDLDAINSRNGIEASADFEGSVTSVSIRRVTKTEEIDLRILRSASFYKYCFTRYRYRKKLVWDCQRYSAAAVLVEIGKTYGDAKIGVCMPMEGVDIGGTLKDADIEPISNSDFEENKQGEIEFIPRKGTIDNKLKVRFYTDDVDDVLDLLSDMDGKLGVFDGNNQGGTMESAIQFGFHQRARITIHGSRYSTLVITTKGVL